ncbi:MAG TPA: DinB family protein [Pyrinomonadaceae bacterium]|nr:DinB family protein [Pyrinomonadaceae bacterium]
MTDDERRELIARYEDGYAEVVRSLEGFPAERLTDRPLPGKWSACEIVHHLADSEMTSAIRLRKLLAEDGPVIQGYDQDDFAARLRYNERPDLTAPLEAFRQARVTTAQIIAHMTDEDWSRSGTHTESGPYSAEDWLRIYAAHAHGHAEQISRLKKAVTGDK